MSQKPLHILLAEDDESDRLIFTEAFAEIKIKTIVRTVNDGEELMDTLNSGASKLPDVIFLDLNMPRKNGITCLKEIKSDKKLKDISIAIYSTSDNENDVDETFHFGANVYITKPNDFALLKQVLQKAVMTAYQYKDESLKRENFLLKI